MAHVDARLKSEEAAYAAEMYRHLDRELKAQREAILAGRLSVAQLHNPDSAIFASRGLLRERLIDIVMRVKNFGVEQVTEEMARQGVAPEDTQT